MFKNVKLCHDRPDTDGDCPISKPSYMLDLPNLARLLCKIKIWADLEEEAKFRAFVLPSEVRHVRFFGAADNGLIATLDASDTTALTAYDLGDVLTWHVDYRDRTWLSTTVQQLDAASIDLFVAFNR